MKIKELFLQNVTKPVWIFILGLIFSFIPFFSPTSSVDNLRYSGIILQILGVAKIFWEISSVKRHFNLPSYSDKLKSFFHRLFRKEKVINLETALFESEVLKARLTARYELPSDPDNRDMAAAFNWFSDYFSSQIKSLNSEFDTKISEINKKIEMESKVSLERLDSVRDDIKSYATGGFEVSLLSAFWIILGIIFSSLSPEIVSLFK